MEHSLTQPFSWYDAEPEVKQLLLLASENREDASLSENYVRKALFKAGDNLSVLVGAYRFFFYQHQPTVALAIARQVLQSITARENLPAQWSQLKPILEARQQNANIRLYLNTYAAISLVLAQLGEIEEAKLISQRVRGIDDTRQFCATTVFDILSHSPDEDE
ncbi:MAG: hypothetical protein GVY17_00905 [Cyanobacteria bacterium]|jgi:hypothetical protein|nr:hypothetical protein [Cyanobacteria bacterium GSL.Bin21]